jgi:hypothetical protein
LFLCIGTVSLDALYSLQLHTVFAPNLPFQVLSPLSATAVCIFEAPATETGWRIAVGFDTGLSFFCFLNPSPNYQNSAFGLLPPPPLPPHPATVLRALLLFLKSSRHNLSGMVRVMEGDLDTIFRNFFRFEGIALWHGSPVQTFTLFTVKTPRRTRAKASRRSRNSSDHLR